MQVTIEELSPVEKKVAVEIPWPYVAQKLDEAYRDLGKGVALKGFRKGKVPRPMLEKMFGRQVERDVVQKLVQESFFIAANQHDLKVVAEPVVDDAQLEKGKAFHYSARVEVASQVNVEPRDYEGVELNERAPKVEDADIDRAIERKRAELTEYRPIEGRAEMVTGPNDVVLLEMKGTVGDRNIERELMVELDQPERAFIPGLAEALRGLPLNTAGKEIEFAVPPAPEPKAGEPEVSKGRVELTGKPVKLTVTFKEVREKQMPALDDEFAKDTGEADTLAELRDKIRARLVEEDEKRAKQELRRDLVKELLKKVSFAVAPALVERQLDTLIQRAMLGLAIQGVDVRSMPVDEQRLRDELREQAHDEVRAAFLVDAIADKEKVEVTEADLEKRLAEMAAAREKSVARLRAELQKEGRLDGVRHQLREEKTLDLLLSRAKIQKTG
jgi:trigger factor